MGKKVAAKKPTKCEVGSTLLCTGKPTVHLSGVLKGDPKFWCCLGCQVWLKRNGVRTKQVVS